MNESQSVSVTPHHFSYPDSIGDEYEDYVADEYGYHYHAWEVISASESALHEKLRLLPLEMLTDYSAEDQHLTDLHRWALAQRYLHIGDLQNYFSFLTPLLTGDRCHPALLYPEVFAQAAREEARRGNLTRGLALAEAIGEHWPPFQKAVGLLQAQLYLLHGQVEESHRQYHDALAVLEEDGQDPELFFEIAEDFAHLKHFSFAFTWLDTAEEEASSQGDTALLVDIELLRRALPQSSLEEKGE